jgi:hypothetical protein
VHSIGERPARQAEKEAEGERRIRRDRDPLPHFQAFERGGGMGTHVITKTG